MESLFARTLCASDPGFGLSSPFFLREDQTGFCVCVCYFLRQKRLKIVQNLYRWVESVRKCALAIRSVTTRGRWLIS